MIELFLQLVFLFKSKFCNAWQREPACSASLDSFCHCIHVVEIDLNDVVELIVVDGGTQQGRYTHSSYYHCIKANK